MGEKTDAYLKIAARTLGNEVNSKVHTFVPVLDGYWSHLRTYFEVDNTYVVKKLRIVLFAALLKGKRWKREEKLESGDERDSKYAPPTMDENAPDLYIPLMSFVTYVVLCSYIKGTNGKFTPEVFTQVTYSCLGFQLLQWVAMKCALAVLNSTRSSALDLFARTGYKYVGLCLTMIVGLFLGKTAYYGAVLWTGVMGGYAMLRALSNNEARHVSGVESSPLRMPLLWSLSFVEFLSMWWLGYARDLD